MMSPQDYVFVSSLIVFITCNKPTGGERTITVDSNNCGGRIDIDNVQRLYLNYYGAELEKKYCLYNVTSYNTNPESEICIYYHDHDSWDITCGSSVKIHIGKYYGQNFPSRYHCSSFDPLCTSEKKVFLEYQYDKALHIMGLDVNLKFDIFVRIKPETTTKQMKTTRLPVSSRSRGVSGFSVIWIVLIAIGGFLFLIFCSALCFYCCCSNEEKEQTQSQSIQPVEENADSMRMLETPDVHVPPENLHSHSTDPPDYYTVCSGDGQYNSCSKGNGDVKVLPSAPLQPSAPPIDASPPPYSEMY